MSTRLKQHALLNERHPHCLACNYDLVATIDAGRSICPECGESFEPHEVRRAPRDDDWTPGRALKALATALGKRIAMTTFIWTGITLLLIHGTPMLGDHAILLVLPIGLMLISGTLVGQFMSRGSVDIAGCSGPLVLGPCVIASIVAISLGTQLALLISPFGADRASLIIVASSVVAVARSVFIVLLDD